MTPKCVDAPQGLRSGLYAPTCSLISPLFAKFCTVLQISLCLFSLTLIFCNCANLNRSCTCKCNHCSFIRFIATS